MLLNFDIWHEIISYLEYPEDEPTLRSLAVTSSMPSGLALDAIWRNGENFLTIVSVINSFATTPDEPFLEYIYEDEGSSEESDDEESSTPPRSGAWVLDRPLPHASRKRALEYLARIRKLTVFQSRPARTEELLWPILAACLDSPGPLLPSLRHLEIDKAIYGRVDCLAPILSPAIKILEIATMLLPEDKLTLPILNLAKARSCDLQFFTYDGGPIQRAPEIIALFKNLQDVRVPLNYPLQKESSITVFEFLTSLSSLRSLTCNLAVFPHSTTEDTICHNSLQKIHIMSPAIKLRELFRSCIFPSVTEVKITKNGSDVLGFEGLDSCFPNVQKLELRAEPLRDANGAPPLVLKHLAPLLSLPVRALDLEVANLNLTPADLRMLSESWPDLYSLRLWSMNERGSDVLSSLAAFSGHPRLCHLDLDIRPRYLLDDTIKVPDLMAAHVPTRSPPSNSCYLYFISVGPSLRETRITTRAEKRMLVAFLLLLFPNLEGLEFRYSKPRGRTFPDAEALAELQEILLELRKEREGPIGSV